MKNTAIVLGIQERQLEFWLLGFVIALIMGGSQALSRSLFAQMIPQGQEAEFYSFYEISERGTSRIGPFGLWSVQPDVQQPALWHPVGDPILHRGVDHPAFVNVPKAMKEGKAQ